MIKAIDRTPTKRDPTKKIIFEYAEIASEEELEEHLDNIANAFKLVALEIIKINENKNAPVAAGTALTDAKVINL